MKHLDFSLFTFFALLIFSQPSFAQKPNAKQLPVRENYEWQGELPVYVEQLKQELTYPMAWGNSPIKNFAKWKKAARQKIFELLLSAKHSDLKFDLLICRTADYIHVYPHVYRRKNCLLSRNQANWGTFQST